MNAIAWLDIKYTFRNLAKNRSYSLLLITIMAVGMGLCIYTYSFIHGIALKSLPFENGERIVKIDQFHNGTVKNSAYNLNEFEALVKEQVSFEAMGYFRTEATNLNFEDSSMFVVSAYIDDEMFRITSTMPILGRAFTESDLDSTVSQVAIISYELWKEKFDQSEGVIGRHIRAGNIDVEVVGVMPEGFSFPLAHDLWLPNPLGGNASKDLQIYSLYGVLHRGLTQKKAENELKIIFEQYKRNSKDYAEDKTPKILSFQLSAMGEGVKSIFYVMLFSVFLVLILACVNVVNLVLARMNERSKEAAIRYALGAPIRRLVVQLVSETFFVTLMSSLFAVLIAYFGLSVTRSVVFILSQGKELFFWQMYIDSHIFMFVLAVVILCTIITSVVPVLRVVWGNPAKGLNTGTTGVQSKKSSKTNKVLVIAEICLSCVLLSVAVMTGVTSIEVSTADYGVDTKNMYTARIHLPQEAYPDENDNPRVIGELLDHISEFSGAEYAAIGALPGERPTGVRPIELRSNAGEVGYRHPESQVVGVSVTGLDVLGVDLVQGRRFNSGDSRKSTAVAIVTKSFVDQVFHAEKFSLGSEVRFYTKGEYKPWITIVGVVDHVVFGDPIEPGRSKPTVFLPMDQIGVRDVTVFTRSNKSLSALVSDISSSLGAYDQSITAREIQEYKTLIDTNATGFSLIANIFNVFGVVALLLASTGVYAVVKSTILMRNREISIRRAIGGSDSGIVFMLLKSGAKKLFLGLIIGVPMAYLLCKIMVANAMANQNSLIFAMIFVPLLISTMFVISIYVPAKRSIFHEPAIGLKVE